MPRPPCCALRVRPRPSGRSSRPSTRATPTRSCWPTSTCRPCRRSRRARRASSGSSRASSPRPSRASARRSARDRAAHTPPADPPVSGLIIRGLSCSRRVRTSTPRGRASSLTVAWRVSAPENTLLAFQRAFEVGATHLETDVHTSRDGVAVISHDPDLARLAGATATHRRSLGRRAARHRPRSRPVVLHPRGRPDDVPDSSLQHRREGCRLHRERRSDGAGGARPRAGADHLVLGTAPGRRRGAPARSRVVGIRIASSCGRCSVHAPVCAATRAGV